MARHKYFDLNQINVMSRAKNIRRMLAIATPNCLSNPQYEVLTIPHHFNTLLRIPWVRTHLFHHGCELFKLETYRKLQTTLMNGGGGQIKSTIHDLLPFIRRESQENSVAGQQLKELLCLMVQEIQSASFSDGEPTVAVHQKIPLYRWIFILIGYISSFDIGLDVRLFIDRLLEIYIKANQQRLNLNPRKITDPIESEVLGMLRDYIETAEIDYELLFGERKRTIVMTPTLSEPIELPCLPPIHDKKLLIRGLMHRETYRALLRSHHPFGKRILELGYNLNPRNYNVLKYELSFFDGMGDFFLAHEALVLLYNVYDESKLSEMRCHLYHMLRLILGTNTLLAKLAFTYGLYQGILDDELNGVILNEYITTYGLGTSEQDKCDRVYQEEFLGDYFEAYVGALFWEQPQIAANFVRAIYQSVLKAITEQLPPEISYSHWTWNIMGRSLVDKRTHN